MKNIGISVIVCISFFILCPPVFARDFIIEYIEENYQETTEQFSNDLLIYHSIQIHSSAGPKMLILSGEDSHYRKWLRYYLSRNNKFIARIESEQVDEFVTSKAYEIDITSLHPFNAEKWNEKDPVASSGGLAIEGNEHILILDPDEKRTHLIQLVVKKLGYTGMVFTNGRQAWETYRLQPQKFKMIIAYHTLDETSAEQFIKQALKINRTTPIVIDTGYKNHELRNSFTSKFSGFRSVHIKPVLLEELEKTIETLVKKNA